MKACSAGPCKDLKKIYLWGAPITCTSESSLSVDGLLSLIVQLRLSVWLCGATESLCGTFVREVC